MASNPVPGAENGHGALAVETAGVLYERYRDRVFGYCLYMLGNRDDADDAAQTTFLQAFRALRRGVVPAAETAWLLTIAENVCLSWRRSAARRTRVESTTDVAELHEVVPARERVADDLIGLGDALAEMPPAQRSAILLREWQGLSYREIGERLKLSQAAVETLLFRARRTLAKNLTVPPAARRRLSRALDFGGLVGALKSAFGGASAVKVATTVAAVAAGTVIGGSTAVGDRGLAIREAYKEAEVVLAGDAADIDGASSRSAGSAVAALDPAAAAARGNAATAKQHRAGPTEEPLTGPESTATASLVAGGGSWLSAGEESVGNAAVPAASLPSVDLPTSPASLLPLVAPSLPSLNPPSPDPVSLALAPSALPVEAPLALELPSPNQPPLLVEAPSLSTSLLPLELPALPVQPSAPLEPPSLSPPSLPLELPSVNPPSLPLQPPSVNPPSLPLEPPSVNPALPLERPAVPLEPPVLPLESQTLPLEPPALPPPPPAPPEPPPLPIQPPAPLEPPALPPAPTGPLELVQPPALPSLPLP